MTEWKKEDVGKETPVFIEGVKVIDMIVEVMLPDGQVIIGPQLACAHIFARYSMVPAMEMVSEATQKTIESMEGDA